MRLALFQPDIPQNTGTILRLAACLGIQVDIIGPAGFDLSDRALKRAGLDYLAMAAFELHADFESFFARRIGAEGGRLVLATTRATQSHLDHAFGAADILLLGRESAGVPEHVHERAACRLRIPMRPGARSLNLAVAAAIVLGEALRQTHGFAPLA
jgi:tRNA (cytidine/uridine-2'-O-)-methyltransferase